MQIFYSKFISLSILHLYIVAPPVGIPILVILISHDDLGSICGRKTFAIPSLSTFAGTQYIQDPE